MILKEDIDPNINAINDAFNNVSPALRSREVKIALITRCIKTDDGWRKLITSMKMQISRPIDVVKVELLDLFKEIAGNRMASPPIFDRINGVSINEDITLYSLLVMQLEYYLSLP